MMNILFLTLFLPLNIDCFFVNFFGIRNLKNKNFLNLNFKLNMNNCHCHNNLFNNKTEVYLNNSGNFSLPLPLELPLELPSQIPINKFKKLDDNWDDGEIPWDIDLLLPSNPFS